MLTWRVSDLSLPLVDEKAALPAIIVTPSSPIGETDFSIAFLAPPSKPTLYERVSAAVSRIPKVSSLKPLRLPSKIKLPPSPYSTHFDTPSTAWSLKARASTTILLAILIFIMACHLLMHSLVAFHPRLDYGVASDESVIAAVTSGKMDALGGVPRDASDADTPTVGGLFNLHSLWAPSHMSGSRRHAHFIVSDSEDEPVVVPAPPSSSS